MNGRHKVVGDRLAKVRQEVDDILSGRKVPEPDPFIQKYFGCSFMEAYAKCLLEHADDGQYLTEEEIQEGSLY